MKKERILNSSGKKKLFIIAAALVAFFTIYSLVLPAITLDNDTAGDEPGLNTDTISQEETNIYNTVYDPFSIEQEKENELKQAEDTIFFYYESEDIKVTVEAPKDAFPEGTEMVVTPIAEEEVLETVTNTIEKVKRVQAVDITFYYNGEEIEPLKPIKVSLVSEVIKEAMDLQIVHIDDEGTGTLVEQADVETEEDEVVFESKDFSTYVVVETEIETTVITADGEKYNITVSYDENAMIPEGAHLEAEEILPEDERYQEYYNTLADLLESELNYVRLFDISIMNGEEKVQPEVEVNVKIELDDLTSEEENLKAVHISDEGETEVLDVQVSEETRDSEEVKAVEFEAKGFSVYAVVGDGSTADEARATVNFYGKNTTTPIATVYVKNSDTAAELEDIVYDPGCGELDASKKELFDGWIISTKNTTDGTEYDADTEGKTIEQVRTYLAGLEIAEGDVVNIYAKIVRTITISYQGEVENILLGTVNLKVLGSDDPNDEANIATYTINMNYTPQTSTQAFMGWLVVDGTSNILSAVSGGENVEPPYQNGTVITVKGDITLSVNAPYGHWLVFDENGKGATYNAPQFIKEHEVTAAPSLDMVRLGYTFDGWHKLKNDVDITSVPKDTSGSYIITNQYFEPFVFGGELQDNITIYAKWISTTTANYTVIVWKERMSDTYAVNGGTGEGKTKNYDFAESYTFSGTVGQYANAVSDGTSTVTDGDEDSTVYKNARIQGTEVGGGNIDKTVSYTGYHCASYDKNVEIVPEGNSAVNIYYDRNTVTYTFYTYGSSTSGGTWYLCRENGSRIVASGSNAPSNTLATYNGSSYDAYSGKVEYGDGNTYYYSTGGGCSPERMLEAHWEYVADTGSQWNVYQESIGLYGEKLDWPEDNSIWWYEDHDSTQGTGTRMTYKDAFLPMDNNMKVEYWGNEKSATGRVHFWTQDVEGGQNYTDQIQVQAGGGGASRFYINDKFTGFYAVQYRVDNGTWQNVEALDPSTGIYGSAVSYQNRLDIRYNRIKAAITFMDGAYFDGNGNPVDETPQAGAIYTTNEYYYEADVRSYNKNGNNYFTPQGKEGFTFAGWYADDTCTVPYNFTTMPATGITVYAKWVKNQYRVFLHPNVPESDTTLQWGSENQDMNFRISSGSKVSAPTGTRSEYKFIGWYLDEGCTEVFDADRFVLNDTTVTTPYDKTVDLTDPMNKYGNIEGTGYNSDLTGYEGGDRFWITRKLDLYAKWRAELIGAQGIGVKYDPNGGSGAPSDTTLYMDNTDTVAQGASTPSDNTQQFLYWVLQKWDTDKYVDITDGDGHPVHVYPGETFTVLKANAQIVQLPESTEQDPKYSYTIQLRAEYGPKDEPTPTHLIWYANGGVLATDSTKDRIEDPALQINQAEDIRPAGTFVRDGYEFIGWARVDSTTEGYVIEEKDLTRDDLFLKYENGKFYAQITEGSEAWTEVTQIAADEKDPYHDLYAVWDVKKYTVTVIKSVNGIESDNEIPFTFTPSFTGLTGETYNSPFQLVGKEGGADVTEGNVTVHYDHSKEFIEVPFNTEFSITETENSAFDVICKYTVTDADDESENKTVLNVSNGTTITVKGNVELTVINTRKTQQVKILKTEEDSTTPLGGAVFTVNVGGTDYTLTSDATDGYLKNAIFSDGILMVPYGTYELTETTAPDGYIPLSSSVSITVDVSGIHASPYNVTEPTAENNYFVITIPNNPGVVLPNTGGSGRRGFTSVGIALIAIASCLMLFDKKRNDNRGN